MQLRSFFNLLVFLLFTANAQAQCEDYQMLKAINSSGALLNYLAQNGFTETSHPDSSFFYYEGKHKGDYMKVGKGWKGEVFEMGWSTVDETGTTIPERLRLGDLQFAATYKENRKLHPSIFSSKKPLPGGISDFVNFDLGDSKVFYKFDEASGSKNPKLTQIIMLRPNNNRQNLKAMNRRSRCLEKLTMANVPEGTNAFVSEILDDTKFHFKKALSLSLKKDQVVTLDLPTSLLVPDQNKDAVIYIKPRKPNDCINLECTTTLNFKITSEDGESLGDTYRLKKSTSSTRYTNTTHNLTNDLDRKISFTAELSTSEDLEVDVYYFEGPTATEAFITHSSYARKVLEQPVYIDAFAREVTAWKERNGAGLTEYFGIELVPSVSYKFFDNEISATGSTRPRHFLIKAVAAAAPTFKLHFEGYKADGNNQGVITIDPEHPSYSYVDGYHLYDFELDISHWSWLTFLVKTGNEKSTLINAYMDVDDPDSTRYHFETAALYTTRSEDYFGMLEEKKRLFQEGVKRDLESFDSKTKAASRPKGDYLNAVENRITAAATAGTNVSKSVKAILDQLGAGQNTSARLKQLNDEYATFKAHVSQATLYAINAKCDKAYNLLSNIEDDWFGYGGEAIQVDFANMENAANAGNQKDFARWSLYFVKSMQKIGDKLENALSAVDGCR